LQSGDPSDETWAAAQSSLLAVANPAWDATIAGTDRELHKARFFAGEKGQMGPSCWKQNSLCCLRYVFLVAAVLCGLPPAVNPLLAQSDATPSRSSSGKQQDVSSSAPAAGQTQDSDAIGTISGTVLDATGMPVSGAVVTLTHEAGTATVETSTTQDGHFSLTNLDSGPFEITVALAGFKTKSVAGTVPEKQDYVVPEIKLELAALVTDVSVKPQEVIAEEQMKAQEQQRLIGVIPNFYASYIEDAVPMNPGQKFRLAWKLAIDPTSFLIAGIIAGGQQANNSLPGYGQGAAGYFNRFGAAYGDFFIGTYISNAILPSILKQDPRYFYKGTGTTKSRILYALKRSVMARGDNGKWQPDYSGLLGSLAAGGISNLYYPPGDRHGFETTLNNTLIGIGTNAGVNILQEFVFRKVTPKLPKADPKN
jgi:hypothetical protein